LYFLDSTGNMLAAPLIATGDTFEVGAPTSLFPTRIRNRGEINAGWQYDVAPDGRFLINTELEGATDPITLILNWNPEAAQ